MDIGAGTFVVSSALTSNYARRKSIYTTKLTNSLNNTNTWTNKLFLLWQKFAVLFLGIGRLILIKYLNYQEHTSEYGTHWNFFVTLFFIWLITDLIHILCIYLKLNENYVLPIISISCICIYQYYLVTTSLTNYIFTSPRDSFLSHNREGIFSLFGDIPLYLLTEWFSHNIFFNSLSSSPSPISSPSPTLNESLGNSLSFKTTLQNLIHQKQFISLIISIIFLYCSYYFSSIFIQSPSRRLMNISFISVILLISLVNILVLYIIDFFINITSSSSSPSSSCVSNHSLPTKTLYLFNDHQLLLFLIANIMTGMINMIFETIYMSTLPSFIILVCYMTILVYISWFLKTKSSFTSK